MTRRSIIDASLRGDHMNTGIRTCVIGSLLAAAALWIDLAIQVLALAGK